MKMKKYLSVGLAAVAVLVLATGCGKKDETGVSVAG